MEKIFDYVILDKIDESQKSTIYRAKKEGQKNTVIIKLLKSANPTPAEIARFRYEYESIKSIDIDGIVKTYDILNRDNRIFLVLEDFGGFPLKKILKISKMSIKDFLVIAIKISKILGELHKLNIMHYDIKPANILQNDWDGAVKLTDFGIAKILTHEDDEIYNPAVIEGVLPYISPEQTGRINRPVDYRSDLYSLGITFYEMLAGVPPFRSRDPMEIIHSHIAKKALPVSKFNDSVPQVISEIVDKLLSKTPEERYQNSFGLAMDLQECLRQLEESGTIADFELGSKDISPRFNIPQKLIGREQEIGEIMSSFERISAVLPADARNRLIELLLVAGHPGVGKSALINEINKPILAKRGYFITGKYEQFRKDVPYSSIIQALQSLAKQVLAESRDMIEIWKGELLKVISPNGRIITDVIPEFELIIGKQPDIPALGLEQSQNRFNLVFKNFIKVFARMEHPLVVFLDDLQWADQASLILIKNILLDPDINFLLIIGTYRDNEADFSQNLMAVIDELIEKGVPVKTIRLRPLSVHQVNQLIVNLLRCREDDSMAFSQLVHKKTDGNPFFVNQFLKTLYEEKLLSFQNISHPCSASEKAGDWIWDLDTISKLQVTGNVLDLMASKIAKLPGPTFEVLKICACIGNRFDLETISHIFSKSIDETLYILSDAIREGLISLYGDMYKFYHDRIQETVYLLIPDTEKAGLHYKIGRYALDVIKEDQLREKVLYIVDQLNAGISLITSEEEKFKLAELNLLAGTKAKASAAYESALKYLKTGISLIGHESWSQRYSLTLWLYEEAVESAYLSIDYEEMDRLSNILLANARSLRDKVKVYVAIMYSLLAQNRRMDGLKLGLEVLGYFGVKLPANPRLIHIIKGLMLTKLAIFRRRSENFIDYPEMKDPDKLASILIISVLTIASYWALPRLLPLLVFKAVKLSLKYGNTAYTPYYYAGMGLVLCSIGEFDSGFKFGDLALNLLDRMNVKVQYARTHFVVNTFITHYREHIRKTIRPLLQAYQNGLQNGDFDISAHSLEILCYHSLFAGIELGSLSNDMKIYSDRVDRIKQKTQYIEIQKYRQTVTNLILPVKEPCRLKGEFYDEDEMLPIHIEGNERTSILTVYLRRVMLCYLFNAYNDAVEYSKKVLKDQDAVAGTFSIPVFYFYYSLSLLALLDGNESRRRKRKILKAVINNQKKMKIWAGNAPMNHLHRYYLIEAEIARVKGSYLAAEDMYDKSIKTAGDNEFINDEAIANEVAGRFFLRRGMEIIAQAYITAAYNAYGQWGATNKLIDLETRFPGLINKQIKLKKALSENDKNSMIDIASESLDLSTVMKASLAIASEIDLGRLLNQLMTLAMENAGAQKGFLILENERDGNLYIEAESEIDRNIEILQSIPVSKSEKLCISIVNYVNKTMENVVLADAYTSGIFMNDPYIAANKIKSVLCAPISDKGKMAGILYLENNLATGVFTPERLKLLGLLSSQAAISINNARLVDKETRNAVLQKEIEMAKLIHQSILPTSLPDIKQVRLAYKYVPMMGIGGDFISFRYNENINYLGMFICDVSGHGVSAAMTASMISMALDFFWDANIKNPSKTLYEMRNQLKGKMGGNFFTAMICSIDLNNRMLTFSTAGHPPLIVIRNDGAVEMITTKGRLINDFFEPNLSEKTITMQKGDRLILYTDGVTEAENARREMLGSDDIKFCDWIKEISSLSPSPGYLCELSFKRVSEYIKRDSLDDDFTIIAAEFTD